MARAIFCRDGLDKGQNKDGPEPGAAGAGARSEPGAAGSGAVWCVVWCCAVSCAVLCCCAVPEPLSPYPSPLQAKPSRTEGRIRQQGYEDRKDKTGKYGR